MMTQNEARALYDALGFVTIPLAPRGKRPLRRGWLDGDPKQWVGAPARANVGVLTGARSGGLVVLDFDTRDGPETVLGMTPQQLAVVTIVVETARGWHVYARAHGVGCTTARAGLDVRGDGGMVVAPPSVHPTGHEYRFVGNATGLVSLEAIAPDISAAPPPCAPSEHEPLLEAAGEWILLQAPKLQDAWKKLREPASASWDPSKADFAVARCLWEGGYSVEDVANILCALPGSRARERGREYAVRTAVRARGNGSRG